MSITIDEKLAVDEALLAFEAIDSVQVARLLYQTLQDAKLSKENPRGMDWKGASSLGRLIKDKSNWETLQSVEAAIESSIRLPLIKATDTSFRNQFPTVLKRLPEDHRQVLAFVLGKMDANELVNLTKLLFETVVQAQFDREKNVVDTFGRFYWSGYTWDELSRSPPVMAEILKPIVDACHGFFRKAFSNVFSIEEPKIVEHEPATPVIQEPAKQEALPSMDLPTAPKIDPPALMPVPESGEQAIEPEFATPEEILARAAEDERKPQFRGKQKNGKDTKEATAVPSTEASAEPPAEPPANTISEPALSAPQAQETAPEGSPATGEVSQ